MTVVRRDFVFLQADNYFILQPLIRKDPPMTETGTLLTKLDRFIRKYYKNRLIRGVLWTLTLLTALYLVFVGLENFFRFTPAGRTILFFSFLAFMTLFFIRLIFTPLFQLLRIGKVLTYDEAARIIGTHFTEIQDKLLNTLQLIRLQQDTGIDSGLLAAGIQQKTDSLKVFRFNIAIDLRKNLKYLKYLLVPVAVLVLIAFLSPRSISEPTRRIIRFSQPFEPPLPFTVEVINKSLTAIQQDDFELQVKLNGAEIPAELFVKTGGNTFRMQRGRNFIFSHTFKSVQSNIDFRVVAQDYQSAEFELKVFPKPTILNFEVSAEYPAYTGKIPEKIENQGDFIVPEGTTLSWKFFTKDVSQIRFRMGDEVTMLGKGSSNTFIHGIHVNKSFSYSIMPLNPNTYLADSLRYQVNVVSDGYPSIFVTESTDSTLASTLFFKGTIKDDYGFTRLTFTYSVYSPGDTTAKETRSEIIPIEKSVNNQVFYYTADLASLMPVAGQTIRYFFEIWDNDGIHGPKSTRSEERTLSTPTLDELAHKTEENEKMINREMEQNLSEARSIKKTIDDLNRKMVDQNSLTWQEKKKLEDLIKAAKSIEDKIENIRKKNEENINTGEKYLETSERILEKQKQLNDMMNQMMPEEMKKMIREMQDMLNQVDKDKLGDMLEKMKMSNKELENQLDRNLALMKQLDFDRKLEMTVDELRKNAEEQEKLANETEKGQSPTDDLLKKQEEISKKSDSLAEKIKELQKEGQELEDKADLGDTKGKQDSIDKSLSQSRKNLKEKKEKEASGSQRKAAKQMKELAAQMESSQMENENEQAEEDETNLRMILENLVRLSFDEEAMIGETKQIARNDPRYPELVARQKEFSEKMEVVEDSLKAIAKRQIEVKPVVTKEINAINDGIARALEALEARNISLATVKQQLAMTSINNLALLLNEALNKMSMNSSSPSSNSKPGKGSCNNPGGKGKKKTSAKSMKDLQDQIGKQLEKLKAGMEGTKKGGSEGQLPQSEMSREVAKLAAQQEALRNELQKYQDEMGTKGLKDNGSLNQAAREMEQIEKDLVNKRINQETIRRQQSIMSRLLESEKAEQVREMEEKRESTEAKSQKNSNPASNYQYNIKTRASLDNIQLKLPALNSFYKSKVNGYIVKIEN